MKRGPRPKAVLLVVLLLVMINLPWAHSSLQRWQLAQRGSEITVPLVASKRLGSTADPRYFVSFSFPERIPAPRGIRIVEVDEQAYAAARADHELNVRVLRDQPTVYSVDGQVRNNGGLVATLVLDAVLVLLVWLLWRYRSRLRPRLRAVAVDDLTAAEPGGLLERIEVGLYRIRGEITQVDGEELVLDVGDRYVTVLLDGHHNPVAPPGTAEVRGRMIG